MPFVRHVSVSGREANLICAMTRSRSGRTRRPFTRANVQPTRSCAVACSFAEPCAADLLCPGLKTVLSVRRSGPSSAKPSGPWSKTTVTVSLAASSFEPASGDAALGARGPGAFSQARSWRLLAALVLNCRPPQCLHSSGSHSSSSSSEEEEDQPTSDRRTPRGVYIIPQTHTKHSAASVLELLPSAVCRLPSAAQYIVWRYCSVQYKDGARMYELRVAVDTVRTAPPPTQVRATLRAGPPPATSWSPRMYELRVAVDTVRTAPPAPQVQATLVPPSNELFPPSNELLTSTQLRVAVDEQCLNGEQRHEPVHCALRLRRPHYNLALIRIQNRIVL